MYIPLIKVIIWTCILSYSYKLQKGAFIILHIHVTETLNDIYFSYY